MAMPADKIAAARTATAAAVDVIRDGVWFAIISGARSARPVYPAKGMAVADERTRREAREAVLKLQARGGTAMSNWLRLAYELFQSSPATLRHAILLTDGLNGDWPGRLASAIGLCEGTFRCDCRGVRTGWQVSELRRISTALLGTVDIVPDPAGLEASKRGDAETATARLGRAVTLTHQAGNQDTARLPSRVVDVVDEATGTVRLKKQVEAADEMALDSRSTKTVRVKNQ